MPQEVKDRVWGRISLWMHAREVARYAPTPGTQQVGTVAVPVRLLCQLRDAVEAYEQDAD